MGTRNLTLVVLNGEYKVAKYCQGDGYPEGQGKTLAEFIESGRFNAAKLKEQVAKHEFISHDEVEKLWNAFGSSSASEFVLGAKKSETFEKTFPQYTRDIGANIVEMIQEGKAPQTMNDLDFAADSLFCEWAYLINLDEMEVEVYKGFNTDHRLGKTERFHFLEEKAKKEWREGGNRYHPIRLFMTFPIHEFTSKAIKALQEKYESEY